MPALSNTSLFKRLRAALPDGTVFHTPENSIHPAEFTVPGFGNTRAYLFTVTPDRSVPGARPPGEFKIQLIIEGQVRSARGSLKLTDAHTTLLGYSPDFGVFIGWEADLYTAFAYSANVQVREPLLIEARNNGWAVAEPRKLKGTTEVRVGFTAGNLTTYLRASREADKRGLKGIGREAFMLASVPNFRADKLPSRNREFANYVEKERQRINASRLSRDSKFAPRVKEQFGFACAVCSVQLEIVEAAHIIPVNDRKGNDDVWNGLALCPSHHTLFDARRFVVETDLKIAVDDEAVVFLQESDRATGIELLTEYRGKRIRAPLFWKSSNDLQKQMKGALAYNRALSGF